MRRVRLLLLGVSIVLLVLLAVLVERTLHSLDLERQMRQRAVAERVFDEMERGLSRLLDDEEARPIEHYLAAAGENWPFVAAHFELAPNGTLTLSVANGERGAIETALRAAWHGPPAATGSGSASGAQVPGTTVDLRADVGQPAAAEGRVAAARDEVSAFDALRSLNTGAVARQRKLDSYERAPAAAPPARLAETAPLVAKSAPVPAQVPAAAAREEAPAAPIDVPPLRGRALDGQRLMLSRTVLRGHDAYRQGVLLDLDGLGAWLRQQGLGEDVLAGYAQLAFSPSRSADAAPAADGQAYRHRFAEPFDDLSARLTLRPLPGGGGVVYVYLLCGLLLVSGALGLAALYRMIAVMVSYAERRSNFVAAVSHELKTPLTAIRMYGEMLRDGLVASEAKRAEYYRHITAESERLSRLINNVLELGRLEKGTREMHLAGGSLAPVVREVAELLRPHVEGQGAAFTIEIDPALLPVRFERDALMQVLWNLVDNALKYGRDGARPEITLRAWSAAGEVHVAVRDHGPGVATVHLGRVFEPFYRAESELTRRTQGTGIGLALVRGLVERMGGRVSGRNAVDGGFEVEIVFPAA